MNCSFKKPKTWYNVVMKESKSSAVPAYKKVQIFKWLLKKHNCEIRFDYSYYWKDPKKKTQKIWSATPKLSRDGKDLVLTTSSKNFSNLVVFVKLPSKQVTLSYADVLDALLAEVKRDESDCWLTEAGWPYQRKALFLSKDATLEGLCIEFDLAWRDAFGHLLSEKPKN